MELAGRPLINRSEAFTPATGSLNVTVMEVSALTAPGAGVRVARVGGIRSGAVVLKEQSKSRSLLVRLVLKTWTVMTLVPTTR